MQAPPANGCRASCRSATGAPRPSWERRTASPRPLSSSDPRPRARQRAVPRASAGRRQAHAHRCGRARDAPARQGAVHPARSKTLSASSSASRAARFRFARRSIAPRTRSVRPRSKGSGTRACSARASSTAARAPSKSVCAARSSARQRAAAASAEGRSSRCARSSCEVSSLAAPSSWPSLMRASIASVTKRVRPGSRTPATSVASTSGSSWSAARSASPSESSSNPSAQRASNSANPEPVESARLNASSAVACAASTSPV